MSDIEEPPSKLTKFQLGSQYLEGEVMEEGQEEWLSEGILTDDDYNPAAEQDRSGNTSQDETMASINDNSVDQGDTTNSQGCSQDEQENSQGGSQESSQLMRDTLMQSEENIEETLNNFENSQNNNQIDLPADLDAYLIRKTDVTKQDGKKEDKNSDIDGSANQSDDDGNDTDDLLRVLGDGGEVRIRKQDASSDEDDDEYIFRGAQVKTLKVATNALMRKYPATKAVPEDDDITDASGDEADTMKKMFSVQNVKPAQSTTTSAKSTAPTAKSTSGAPVKSATKEANQPREQATKKAVAHRPGQSQQYSHSTPLKTYTNKHRSAASVTGNKSPVKSVVPEHKMFEGRETRSKKAAVVVEKKSVTPEKLPERSYVREKARETQRMMRPEQMDEEVPTDVDSESDEESLYDELPTTDSETNDDWFSLDIRAERAGDYIPLLGPKAHRLLTEEKRRVTERVVSLKESLAALADSGRSQAAQLRQATVALAELDAMLKTA